MIKKGTLFIAIAISLCVGFLAGTIFAVYKLGPAKTSANQPDASSGQQEISLNQEQIQAITTLEAEVEKNHGNGEAWIRLGNLYFDTNQPQKAITAYTHALDLVPANADILTDLGVMYKNNKQPDKALESFDKAIQTNPRHEPARLNKGVVLLFDLGRTAEALEVWQELLGVNPNATTANGQSVRELIADVIQETGGAEKQAPKSK
jgi:cytochrome c-type biogenesis protein CcmH/NrfG